MYKKTNTNSNGRVNIQGPLNIPFMLFHETPNNKNYNEAMTGNWIDTPLSKAFFSLQNIQIIQNGIRAGVYRLSQGRFNVGEQDETNLKIIMRSIFLQEAKYNVNKSIQEQIEELNNKVFDYCVKDVYNEAIAYMKYKNDVSTLVIPLDRPTGTDVKGERQLELKPWF